MIVAGNERTVALKSCRGCGRAIYEQHRFCRWCGASQNSHASSYITLPLNPGTGGAQEDSGATPNNTRAQTTTCRLVSGPLVNSVVNRVHSHTSEMVNGRFARKTITLLVSAPIWLLIILLSPVDAYIASRELTEKL